MTDERVQEAEAGYRVGMTNATGINYMWPAGTHLLDPYDLRRLATDREESDALFLTHIATPQLEWVRRGLALRRPHTS